MASIQKLPNNLESKASHMGGNNVKTPICVEMEVTNLAIAQKEHNAKSDQQVDITEQSIVDLIQPI